MFDRFAKEKSDFLQKKDNSKKGCVDEDAKDIVYLINSKKDYYTTSSCAGRIVLLEMKSRKKNECDWIFAKHGKVEFDEIINALKNKSKIKKQIYFKQQPLILHIACRNIDAAKNLLDAARKVFKHSGIISFNNKRVVVEIIGNERIETIIADKNFVADENYIKKLVNYANENFLQNKIKSGRLLRIIKNL